MHARAAGVGRKVMEMSRARWISGGKRAGLPAATEDIDSIDVIDGPSVRLLRQTEAVITDDFHHKRRLLLVADSSKQLRG